MADRPDVKDWRPEHKLILHCARTSLDGRSLEEMGRIDWATIDWYYLLHCALQQKVMPLLVSNLRRLYSKSIPANYQESMRALYASNAANNLRLTAYAVSLVRVFGNAKIPMLPYKGPALGYQAYGDIAYRQSTDLDILVSRADYERARHLLLERGLNLVADYHWECTLRDRRCGVNVDLHRSLTADQFPVRFDFQYAVQRQEAIPMAGGKIYAPAIEDTLSILSVQIAKDAWGHSYKPMQLGKLCDLAELLRRHTAMDWEKVRRDTKRLGYRGMVGVAVQVAHRLLEAPLPPLDFRGLKAKDSQILIADIESKLLELGGGSSRPHLDRAVFHSKIRELRYDRLHPHYLDLRQRLRPNERDRAFVRLPETADSLYWAVRPIRLLWDGGRHLAKGVRSRLFRR